MTKNNFTPASLDEKNVMTDWIEDVFDKGSGVCCGNKFLGFVNDCPVMASWRDNILYWKFVDTGSSRNFDGIITLKSRLKEYEVENTELVQIISVVGEQVIQQFFWK